MYLFDTHVLLWWLMNSRELSSSLRDLIANPEHTLFVSAASAWEISIKRSLGKLTAPDSLEEALIENDFEPLPISIGHARKAGCLPPHHADPFDRMLIAQAELEGLTIITRDKHFKDYRVSLHIA